MVINVNSESEAKRSWPKEETEVKIPSYFRIETIESGPLIRASAPVVSRWSIMVREFSQKEIISKVEYLKEIFGKKYDFELEQDDGKSVCLDLVCIPKDKHFLNGSLMEELFALGFYINGASHWPVHESIVLLAYAYLEGRD